MNYAKQKLFQSKDHPTLIPVTDDFLPLFSRILEKQKTDDPFLFSPAYFLMTGRHGLWLYGDEESAMVIARHPNRADTILYFPPFGKDPVSLINKALQDSSMPPGKIQIARIPLTMSDFIKDIKTSCHAQIIQETTLDWTYPVHVISIQNVIQHQGPAFKNFRQHICKMNNVPSRIERIDPHTHHQDIMRITSKWATDGRKDGFTREDLMGPVQKALTLMLNKELNISGIIIYHHGEPMSYILWTIPQGMEKVAVPLVRVSIGHMNGVTGTAEFSMLKAMETLAEDGFDFMYLGGSETADLDRFKRKLVPVRSIHLTSADILKEDKNFDQEYII